MLENESERKATELVKWKRLCREPVYVKKQLLFLAPMEPKPKQSDNDNTQLPQITLLRVRIPDQVNNLGLPDEKVRSIMVHYMKKVWDEKKLVIGLHPPGTIGLGIEVSQSLTDVRYKVVHMDDPTDDFEPKMDQPSVCGLFVFGQIKSSILMSEKQKDICERFSIAVFTYGPRRQPSEGIDETALPLAIYNVLSTSFPLELESKLAYSSLK